MDPRRRVCSHEEALKAIQSPVPANGGEQTGLRSLGNGTATASSLLTFYFWPQAEHTGHVAVFYKASGQSSPQIQREKVYFRLRATCCCRAEHGLCSSSFASSPCERWHRRVPWGRNPLPAQQTCCRAPRLQDLLQEKETSPAARTKDNSAPRIPSPHPEPCPGSARPLASRPQRAAQEFRAHREHPRTVRTPNHTEQHGNLLEMLGCSSARLAAHTHDPVSSPGAGGTRTRVLPPATAPGWLLRLLSAISCEPGPGALHTSLFLLITRKHQTRQAFYSSSLNFVMLIRVV